MFGFVVKYLGFLKSVPGLAILFDNGLKLYTLIANPSLLDRIDRLENEVSAWPGITTQTHRYGGLQFNYNGKELGHIHSNSLLDMLLSRAHKHQLLQAGRISHHHIFKDTGWISFYVNTDDDMVYAISLLQIAYQHENKKGSSANISILP